MEKKSLKIFVTGATGFVGSHLCDKLKREGHQVYALVRNEKKLKLLEEKVNIVNGSLASEGQNKWIQVLPDDLDVVYHLAGIVHHFDAQQFITTNFLASKILLDDLKSKYKKDLKIIFLSSLAAAGPTSEKEETIDEEKTPKPVSEYGRSKLLTEEMFAQEIPKNWNLNIFRPPMVIGPRDPAVLDVFKMVKGGFVPVVGHEGHKNNYSFICVFDLIDILFATLYQQKENNKEIYFTSHPQSASFEELVNAIQATQDKRRVRFIHFPFLLLKFFSMVASLIYKILPVEIRITPDKLFELKEKKWLCSGKKVAKDFQYEYQWDLDRTIKVTTEDYKNRGWL